MGQEICCNSLQLRSKGLVAIPKYMLPCDTRDHSLGPPRMQSDPCQGWWEDSRPLLVVVGSAHRLEPPPGPCPHGGQRGSSEPREKVPRPSGRESGPAPRGYPQIRAALGPELSLLPWEKVPGSGFGSCRPDQDSGCEGRWERGVGTPAEEWAAQARMPAVHIQHVASSPRLCGRTDAFGVIMLCGRGPRRVASERVSALPSPPAKPSSPCTWLPSGWCGLGSRSLVKH